VTGDISGGANVGGDVGAVARGPSVGGAADVGGASNVTGDVSGAANVGGDVGGAAERRLSAARRTSAHRT
jgi:hypothetical protein